MGLRIACDRGVEIDYLIAVKLINQGEAVMWEDGSLVFDILDYACACVSCKFVYVRREANALARSIAKLDCLFDHFYVWEGFLPPAIQM